MKKWPNCLLFAYRVCVMEVITKENTHKLNVYTCYKFSSTVVKMKMNNVVRIGQLSYITELDKCMLASKAMKVRKNLKYFLNLCSV